MNYQSYINLDFNTGKSKRNKQTLNNIEVIKDMINRTDDETLNPNDINLSTRQEMPEKH